MGKNKTATNVKSIRGPAQCKKWKNDLFSKNWRTGVAKLRFLVWWKYRDVINWFTRKKKAVVDREKPYIFKPFDNDYEYGKKRLSRRLQTKGFDKDS